jgi:phenylpropionate dioxygenase-like ring-hydroxylating dioxygenase large terminal subunit
VLLTSDEGGKMHAFANTCRHRGAILLEGCGNQRSVVCPYHAWTYRLDGRLRAAPGMQAVPGFTLEAHGLIPVRMAVETRLSLISVPASRWNADGDSATLTPGANP